MKKSIRLLVVALTLLLGIQSVLFAQEKLKIAIVPKNKIGVFWQSVLVGAKLGSVAMGNVEVDWRVPFEENTTSQIAVTEQCIEEGVSGIILAPIEKDSLAIPIVKAVKKKIPVLIFDSQLKGTAGKDYISFVGIDNKKAGAMAGEHLAKLLGGKGKVLLLRVSANQASIMEREKGFIEVIAKNKGIQFSEKELPAGVTINEMTNECLKISNILEKSDGIFCSYEQTTIAMLQALQKIGNAGKVKFVGFDTPTIAVDALKKGEISALMAQDPARMGFMSLKTMVDHIRGKKIETMIDIGVKIVTRENLNSPEIQKLLSLPIMER